MPIINNPNVSSSSQVQLNVNISPPTPPTADDLINALIVGVTNDQFAPYFTPPSNYNPPMTIKEWATTLVNSFFKDGNYSNMATWVPDPMAHPTTFVGAFYSRFSQTYPMTVIVTRNFLNFFDTSLYFKARNSDIGDNDTLAGDLSILTQVTTPPEGQPAITPPTVSASQYFAGAFKALIPKLQSLAPDGRTQPFLDTFFDPSNTVLLQTPDPSGPFADHQSLQAIFEDFYPNSSQNDFAYALQSFYKSYTAGGAAFEPSNVVGAWFQYNLTQSSSALFAAGSSSIDGTDSIKILVINRILALLIKIINSLQQVGIAQTQRLQYTTNYQQAYTNLQSQVPTFLSSDAGPMGGTGSDATNARNELNSSFNSVLVNNIQSFRGLQDDAAKQQQSNVNATNDAVNQQTDMCTTFIQQLSSLLSVIMR
jgi:hypothetical protein